MAFPAPEFALQILRACASGVEPLYPAKYSQATGTNRAALDDVLDQLRMAGLVRLTEWTRENGQGYRATPEGETVLQNPALLHRPPRPSAPPLQPVSEPMSTWQRGELVRATILEPAVPVVTWILIFANVLVFVVGWGIAARGGFGHAYFTGGLQSGNARGIELNVVKATLLRIDSGAFYRPAVIVEHQWWRLLTYGFVHGGFFHILLNMFALYALGPTMETMWGHRRYLYLYLFACFAGGCAVMLDPNVSLVVGASGAISGLLASVGAWLLLNRAHFPPELTSRWLNQVITNVVLLAVMSFLPGVSWHGHLGGFVGGAILSLPLNAQRFGIGRERLLGWAGLVVAPLASIALVVYVNLPALQRAQRLGAVETREFLDFNARFLDRVVREGQAAINVQKQFGKMQFGNAAEKSELRQRALHGERELQNLAAEIEAAGPYGNNVATEVTNIVTFLHAWKELLRVIAVRLSDDPYATAPHGELNNRRQDVMKANENLKTSALLKIS